MFVLPHLGYSFCDDSGYSVHGPFKVLVHGVTPILPKTSDRVPLRVSLAMYSHADIFAGAARFTCSNFDVPKFSDPTLWLPFFPKGFSAELGFQRLKSYASF